MLIKILKGEHIFSEQGTHVCDERGFAIVASEDMDCEVTDRIEIVKQILKDQRAMRGLDENGDPIPPPSEEPVPVNQEPPASNQQSSSEEPLISSSQESSPSEEPPPPVENPASNQESPPSNQELPTSNENV